MAEVGPRLLLCNLISLLLNVKRQWIVPVVPEVKMYRQGDLRFAVKRRLCGIGLSDAVLSFSLSEIMPCGTESFIAQTLIPSGMFGRTSSTVSSKSVKNKH